ncbi:hypothetical protein BRETT_004071 [Brettanomyces bruxellensis]|uniref:Zn(2)-C6 fungal-type domain-containing protein n=1 Tax=Dekkera bruxellensis TaxID=5007 RepID=A0A871QZB9_DEKBR|nr:uncharacterized protein BRETT_004071 [Brettanomyces bruxellensis]QOU18853.1 hypothetical protein BRETT_004071 [Brettanomyces bruxellensis]
MQKRKRNRKFVVCIQCRKRRSKCDRGHPCSRCARLGTDCEYLEANKKPELTSIETHGVTAQNSLIAELQSQINLLKRQIAHPEVNVKREHKSTRPTNSLLDVKIPTLKKISLERGRSNSTFYGPASSLSTIFSEHILEQFSRWNIGLNKERETLISSNLTNETRLSIVNIGSNKDEILQKAEAAICSDYYAFKDCLEWFGTNLNELVFLDAIPTSKLKKAFSALLNPPSSNSSASFKYHTKEPYFFGSMAAIFSVVYLVTLFRRYSLAIEQPPIMTTSIKDLRQLSIQLLIASDLNKNRNIMSLLALIVIKSGLFEYDSIEHDNEWADSYPFFHILLNLCYQLGLHLESSAAIRIVPTDSANSDLFISINTTEKKHIWNLVLLQDAIYSLALGTPLSINSKFCALYQTTTDNTLERLLIRGFKLIRQTSLTVNSIEPISLNMVNTLISDIQELCHDLPCKIFTCEEGQVPDFNLSGLCILFKLKIFLLHVLESLYRMIIMGAAELQKSLTKNELKTEDSKILSKICETSFRQSTFLSAAVVWHIQNFFSGRTVFATSDPRYSLFLRRFCMASCNQSFTIWFTYLFGKMNKSAHIITDIDGDNPLNDYISSSDGSAFQGEVDLQILEDSLFYKYTNKSREFLDSLVCKLLSSSQLMSFSSLFYKNAEESQVMRESLDGMACLKFLLMWIYVIREIEARKATTPLKKIDKKEIILWAKQKVENEMISGVYNDGLIRNFEMHDLDDNILDSIITEDVWIDSLFKNDFAF